ncbi:MAG: enoyl-CoA hydratase-related protein [Dehalococcoidia bacterium]
MSDDSPVLTSVDEHGVMVATLNRPEVMNALNTALGEALIDAINEASRRDDVKALVVTGAGRGFCAGAQVGGGGIESRTEGALPPRHARMDRRAMSAATVEAFSNCDVPVIAAVNGPAAGAGFGLALCCDVRIMAESARMGSIFIKRGLASDYGASYWLPRIVGIARAYEILYDGALMDAPRCLDLGLVSRVVPDDRVLDEAVAHARAIAAGPPLAYTALRRMLQRSTDMPMHDFVEYEWTAQLTLLGTRDAAEGFRAFMEKREPVFKGE